MKTNICKCSTASKGAEEEAREGLSRDGERRMERRRHGNCRGMKRNEEEQRDERG